jgi:dolichol-phosphate mannosyltransferase
MSKTRASIPTLSIVTPAYCEQNNLPTFYRRLRTVCEEHDLAWEWLIIDDCSPDRTFIVACQLATSDSRVRVFRLSRNFGSHAAIYCGVRQARGDALAILAADLQDPPEVLPGMLHKWRNGAAVVWAVRSGRTGESRSTIAAARLYYWIMRHVAGLTALPAEGSDFVLLGRAAIEFVKSCEERNVSIFALLAWAGFRQDSITYEKQSRLHGRSGWTLSKKLKLLVDSVTAFSYLPIRFMSWFGFGIAALGLLYALAVIGSALMGRPTEGWASLMVVTLIIGGFLMTMLGVLGEYVWRNLDATRRRPIYLIEQRFDACEGAPSAPAENASRDSGAHDHARTNPPVARNS